MPQRHRKDPRRLGLVGATGVGVGAIVGGGILALAGVAFAATGPSALLAFALNGAIAVLTALSFAEMSTAFPESGGTYTFAKKVLSVQAAFGVGWIVWFASIVAAVLYALGFASFFSIILQQFLEAAGWQGRLDVRGPVVIAILGLAAASLYAIGLMRRNPGSRQWSTWGKVVIFGVLIAGGLWALAGRPVTEWSGGLKPFFAAGAAGLFQAMGYTFIALQGFDLIAAVAGEVREPVRILPRAMLLSLAVALVIYLPLLFILATVGITPGGSIQEMSRQDPEAIVALAVQNYLGPAGFWLVMVAALLSMLSALQANLYAASRVALAMARDQTLPGFIGQIHSRLRTPTLAVLTSTAAVALILLVISDLGVAGAASSLIFLITFALVHWMSFLARRRVGPARGCFQVPAFPLVPAAGFLSCMALAVFQGSAVPTAGILTTVWIGVGAGLYFSLFSQRARVVDASAEARDPLLLRLRGRSPLVLVPIANPANAAAMVRLATAIAPPRVGRVLLLQVVQPPESWSGKPPPQLLDAQAALGEALTASFAGGLSPEALVSVGRQPWEEIVRVAREHRCESLLLGLTTLSAGAMGTQLEQLISRIDCDTVVFRAPPGWELERVQRVLVPIGGRHEHDELRARLLGGLQRTRLSRITFLRVLPAGTSPKQVGRFSRELERFARDEALGESEVKTVCSDDVAAALSTEAAEADLLILGLQRLARRQKAFGALTWELARRTQCAMTLISRR